MAFVTLKFNFFRPVWQARLRFDARVVNRRENPAYLDCEIAEHDGKRIAKAASTCTVLRGDHAIAR